MTTVPRPGIISWPYYDQVPGTVGNGLRAVPPSIQRPTGSRNGTEAVPYSAANISILTSASFLTDSLGYNGRMNATRLLLAALLLICGFASMGKSPPATSPKPSSPLTPQEELKTLQTRPGFRVELVASEPAIVDPVAMTFDEDGRLYVVEMR